MAHSFATYKNHADIFVCSPDNFQRLTVSRCEESEHIVKISHDISVKMHVHL